MFLTGRVVTNVVGALGLMNGRIGRNGFLRGVPRISLTNILTTSETHRSVIQSLLTLTPEMYL